jgi:hypothetical protein
MVLRRQGQRHFSPNCTCTCACACACTCTDTSIGAGAGARIGSRGSMCCLLHTTVTAGTAGTSNLGPCRGQQPALLGVATAVVLTTTTAVAAATPGQARSSTSNSTSTRTNTSTSNTTTNSSSSCTGISLEGADNAAQLHRGSCNGHCNILPATCDPAPSRRTSTNTTSDAATTTVVVGVNRSGFYADYCFILVD